MMISDYLDFPSDFLFGVDFFPMVQSYDLEQNFQIEDRMNYEILKSTGFNAMKIVIEWEDIYADIEHNELNIIHLDYYDNLINKMLNNKIKPIIELSHSGWLLFDNEKECDVRMKKYVKFAMFMMMRYKDKVLHWIPVAQSFATSDLMDERRWQCVHNELIAYSRISILAKELNNLFLIGINSNYTYSFPSEHSTTAIINSYISNQMETAFSEVLIKGSYPGHVLRFFKDNSISINYRLSELLDFKLVSVDFVQISPYANADSKLNCTYADRLRMSADYYYDKYRKPIIINAELVDHHVESIGNKVHDILNIEYLSSLFNNSREIINDRVEIIGVMFNLQNELKDLAARDSYNWLKNVPKEILQR